MNYYKKELETAIFAAKKAQNVILEVYHKNFEVKLKEDKSVVTEADLKSNQLIRKILADTFPTYSILSEETNDDLTRLDNDYCWIVDPLDGTKDFVNHTNEFSINIALCYKHEIVVGVIAIPCKNLIYYASKDNGSYKLEGNVLTRIFVSDKKDNLDLLVSNFFFKDEELEKIPNRQLIKNVTHCGSSYKACKIAEGIADLNIKFDPATKEWDTAPSDIIVKEAGGIMCDLYGDLINYNRKDFVNRNGYIICNDKELVKSFALKK